MKTIDYRVETDGVDVLTIDVQGKEMNGMTPVVRASLEE